MFTLFFPAPVAGGSTATAVATAAVAAPATAAAAATAAVDEEIGAADPRSRSVSFSSLPPHRCAAAGVLNPLTGGAQNATSGRAFFRPLSSHKWA